MRGECRCAHDRDVNAAKSILSREGVSLARVRERVIAPTLGHGGHTEERHSH